MSNVYAFRSGRSLKNVNPQAVGMELERIRQEKGQLQAADVLEEAHNPESPLHEAFEWDDSLAAAEHRLGQARRLIVSIRVLNGPTQRPVPCYVSVRSPEVGRSYMPVAEVLSDDQLRARLLDDVRVAIETLERKYSAFVGVADLLNNLRRSVG